MKCSILIDCSLIKKDDINVLNESNENIKFITTESHNFLPPEVILILIEFSENLCYSFAYDLLKYGLFKVISLIGNKKRNKKTDEIKTRFEISYNGNKYSLKAEYPLTEKQMDKLVDDAAKVLLLEWGKEKNDEWNF